MQRPELIATDLDNTLLRTDKTVSDVTREVIARTVAAGVPVVPATARQLKSARVIAAHAGISGPVICSNGALGVDLRTGDVLFTQPLEAATVRDIAETVRAANSQVLFACVGPVGEWFRAEPDYVEIAEYTDHHRRMDEMKIVDLDGIMAEDCSKLVLRHPGVGAQSLFELVESLDLPECQITTSGAPFIEVTGPGVTKASGLALLCERLGVERDRVWAFGDAANDVDMLMWAGVGYAMANAVPEVHAVADRTARSCDRDGVAEVLAEIF